MEVKYMLTIEMIISYWFGQNCKIIVWKKKGEYRVNDCHPRDDDHAHQAFDRAGSTRAAANLGTWNPLKKCYLFYFSLYGNNHYLQRLSATKLSNINKNGLAYDSQDIEAQDSFLKPI